MPTIGRPYVAIPGPTVVPDRVLAAMMRPAPDIYAGDLVPMVEGMDAELMALVGTATARPVTYIGNGHAAWEAAIANTFAPGDRALVVATGRFAHGWAAHAERMGVEAEILDHGLAPADPSRVEAALRRGPVRAVLTVQTDTASTIRTDIAGVRAAMDAAGSEALLLVDGVASVGTEAVRMDGWRADLVLAASQKGLMGPPGLAFLWVGERLAAGRDGVSPYWDWRPRLNPSALWERFGGTPPTHGLYALREALTMIAEEGMPQVEARHARLARAVWAAADHWAQGGGPRLCVETPADRAHAVTALHLPGADALRDWVAREMQVTLGIGLGRTPPEDHFRLGHMGHVNAHMVLGALGAIEAGLAALGLPHRPGGVSAAAAALGGGDAVPP